MMEQRKQLGKKRYRNSAFEIPGRQDHHQPQQTNGEMGEHYVEKLLSQIESLLVAVMESLMTNLL